MLDIKHFAVSVMLWKLNKRVSDRKDLVSVDQERGFHGFFSGNGGGKSVLI